MNNEDALSAARHECKLLESQNKYLMDCLRKHCNEIQHLKEELEKNKEALLERDEVYRRLRKITGLLRSN